jgi:hypothetical protein
MTHHYLPQNQSNRIPEHLVYFDSESATETGYPDAEVAQFMEDIKNETPRQDRWGKVIKPTHAEVNHVHQHYLTVACFVDRGSESWRHYDGEQLNDFWSDVSSFVTAKRKVVVIAHNARYDVLVTGAVPQLVALGWTVTAFSEHTPFFMIFENGKRKIEIISSTNYFTVASIKMLGEMVDLSKLEQDYASDDAAAALPYCTRDVEILKKTMESLLTLIKEENLGNFALTIAGLSFNAYRHQFMHKDTISIHRFKEPLKTERQAYCGGRNEAWQLGTVEGPVYLYDVNSMYPCVMQLNKYPVKLMSRYHHIALDKVKELLSRGYLIVADAHVVTDKPCFPLKDERLLFPVGRYWTSLASPEIQYGLQNGLIDEFQNVNVYQGKKLFTDFVDYFYNKRLEAKAAGNKIMDYFYKILLNSLYGKFGQKSLIFELIDSGIDPTLCYDQQIYNMETHEREMYKVFGGSMFRRIEKPDGENESRHSFPAIAAHVTSYARMLLWRYIEMAGVENIFYMDTDSLFVNEAGSQRLQQAGVVSPTELGKIKLERTEQVCELRGCKDYTLGATVKIKGVPKSALQLDSNHFLSAQWPGLAAAIKTGKMQGYGTHLILKHLTREYKKGIVGSSGRVQPFVMNTEMTNG